MDIAKFMKWLGINNDVQLYRLSTAWKNKITSIVSLRPVEISWISD